MTGWYVSWTWLREACLSAPKNLPGVTGFFFNLLVDVLALDYGRVGLGLRGLHPPGLVAVLGGLGVEDGAGLGIIAVVDVPVLRLSEVVVVLLGQDLPVLDGLDGVVVVIL